MAITYTDNGTNTPNGTHKIFTYSFPVLQTEDIKVALNGIVQATTKYTASLSPAQIEFNSTNADATVQNTSTGAPLSGVLVRVYRQTTVGKNSGDEDPKAVFAAGSSIRATDLNANQEQALFAIHELQNQEVLEEKLGSGAVTSAKILDGTIVNADINASAAIAGTKISPDFGSQHIFTTGKINMVEVAELQILDGATVTTDELNKLDGLTASTTELNKLDGFTGSTSDLNVLNGLTASNAELNKLDGATVTTAEINILDGVTATTAEINKLDGVTATTSELNILDGVTATTTELNVLDGISVTTNELNNVYGIGGNIQSQLDNKQPIDAELTELATMSNGTASALADLTQAEVQTLDGVTASTTEINKLDGVTASTTELNLLDGVTATTTELNLNDGQTATPTEVNILDGATLTTNELNKLDGVTASTAELNLLDGKSIVTSISGSATDTQIPSAQAVNERITTVVSDVGGFVPIANETSFPTANPDLDNAAGTIVSIKALTSAFTTGSGVTTHTISNGAGTGKNVTITGLTQSTTYPAGRGLILETTQYSGGGRGGNANEYEYAFHRLTLDETGVADAQAAINDFDERYYGPFSANQPTRPSGANRLNGDLYFNTSDGKMKVFNGSHASGTWDDVAAPGNFFINTISSSSGSGGGSATFNGTATRFTLSNPPLTAQQLLVSINGVVQKPNSGTSPSEGFAISGADIIFASAPVASSPYFIVTIGSSVNIGTPSDGTVTSAKIVDGSIVNADISSSAAIALSKLSTSGTPNNTNFLRGDGAWTVVNTDLVSDTTPQLGGNLETNNNNIKFGDSSGTGSNRIRMGASNDLQIYHDGVDNHIDVAQTLTIKTGGETSAQFDPNGAVYLYFDNSKKFETTSTGTTITGQVKADVNTSLNSDTEYNGQDFGILVGYDGGYDANSEGNGICFAQQYASSDASIVRTGAIIGYKQQATGNFGGGLKFKTQKLGANPMGTALQLDQNQNVLLPNDNAELRIGASGDLKLYHNGTDSIIQNNTNAFFIKSQASARTLTDAFIVNNFADSETIIDARANGAVELYYNGEKMFETEADGVKVFDNNTSVHVRLVSSDGDAGFLYGASNSNIGLLTRDGSWAVKGVHDGTTELYYNGTKKLGTTSSGAEITGQLDITGGYISLDDNYSVVMGTGNDAQLYHSGSHQYLLNTVGNIYIMPKAGEYSISCEPDGAVGLYWDNNLRFETHGTGVSLRSTSPSSGSGEHWSEGSIKPWANNTYDLGDATYRWRSLHVNDAIYFAGNNTTATELDDYEEGTWTPTMITDAANSSMTIQIDHASYTKIGRLVTCFYQIKRNDSNSYGGNLVMQGLPYTVSSSTQSGSFWVDHSGPTAGLGDIAGGLHNLYSTNCYFTQPTRKNNSDTQSTAASRYVLHDQWTNGRWIYGSFTYQTAT